MRRTWIAFGLALASTVPCPAQVINGESTYEDNFLHTPPAEARPAGAAGDVHPRAASHAPETPSAQEPRADAPAR